MRHSSRSIVAGVIAAAISLSNALPVAAQTAPAVMGFGAHPYQHTIQYNHASSPYCPTAHSCVVAFPPVPAGKRLVVTFVSALTWCGAGTMTLSFGPSAAKGINLSNTFTRGNSTAYTYVTSAEVTYYFEATEAPTFFLDSEVSMIDCAVTTGTSRMSVVGHLVSAR